MVIYFKLLVHDAKNKHLLKMINEVNKKRVSVINIYLTVLQLVKSNPKLFIPFIIFVIVDLFFLFLIFVAPRQPFNVVLAPPIRAFWGEKFLHYPANFLLLPKLASLSRNFLACVIGSLLTGCAVTMAADSYNNKITRFLTALKAGLRKYLALFSVVFIITLLFGGCLKLLEFGLIKYFSSGHATLLFIKPRVWFGPLLIIINLSFTLLIQGAFVYAIPLIMLEKEKVFQAIFKSMGLFKKFFVPTVFLFGVPVLFYLPIIVLQFKTSFLISWFFPELVLYICVAASIINSLVIDLLITFSTTVLFLQNKE